MSTYSVLVLCHQTETNTNVASGVAMDDTHWAYVQVCMVLEETTSKESTFSFTVLQRSSSDKSLTGDELKLTKKFDFVCVIGCKENKVPDWLCLSVDADTAPGVRFLLQAAETCLKPAGVLMAIGIATEIQDVLLEYHSFFEDVYILKTSYIPPPKKELLTLEWTMAKRSERGTSGSKVYLRAQDYRDKIAKLEKKNEAENARLGEDVRKTKIKNKDLKADINNLYVNTPGLGTFTSSVKSSYYKIEEKHRKYLTYDITWRLESQVLIDFLREKNTSEAGVPCVCIPHVNQHRPAESYQPVGTGMKSVFSLSRTIEHVIDRCSQYSGVSRGVSRSSRKKSSQPKNLEVCASKKKSSKAMDSLMVFCVKNKATGGGHVNLLYFDASAETIFLVEPNGYENADKYDGESQLKQALADLPAKFKNWKYELLQIGNVHARFVSPNSKGICKLMCMWIIVEYCRTRTTTKTRKTLQVFTEELMGFFDDRQLTPPEGPAPKEKDFALAMLETELNGTKQRPENRSKLLKKKKTTQRYLEAMKKTAEDFKQYHARYAVRYMVARSVGALNRHFGYKDASNMFVLLSGTGGAGYEHHQFDTIGKSGGESLLLTVNHGTANKQNFVVAREKLGR
jgi:hypothetical protein